MRGGGSGRSRAEAAGPALVLNLLKPPGMTSHDVVDVVRRTTGMARAGHAGTLDPAAAGVLVAMTGPLARLSPYLMAYDKRYRVEITFGVATETGDAEGQIEREMDASGLDEAQVAEALASFPGVVLMKPHRFSAAKVGGKKAYEVARHGQEPELTERAVVLHEVRLLAFEPGRRALALVDVHCGKGTYVRSLAEMAGERVGSCAHASFVLRTQVGPIAVEAAATLEEVAAAAADGRLEELAVPLPAALLGYPQVTVSAEQARHLASGAPLPYPEGGKIGDAVALFGEDRRLVGMAEVRGGQPQVLQPRTILAGG